MSLKPDRAHEVHCACSHVYREHHRLEQESFCVSEISFVSERLKWYQGAEEVVVGAMVGWMNAQTWLAKRHQARHPRSRDEETWFRSRT